MSRTVIEIRDALSSVASKWADSTISEKGGAQSFLNDLVAAYTGSTVIDSGGEFERPVKRDDGRGFIDMIWDGVVLFEMKAPKETPRLDTHRAQLLDYWRNCADVETGVAAPPYAVLCSVHSRQSRCMMVGGERAEPRYGSAVERAALGPTRGRMK